jgi:hypothetical protein
VVSIGRTWYPINRTYTFLRTFVASSLFVLHSLSSIFPTLLLFIHLPHSPPFYPSSPLSSFLSIFPTLLLFIPLPHSPPFYPSSPPFATHRLRPPAPCVNRHPAPLCSPSVWNSRKISSPKQVMHSPYCIRHTAFAILHYTALYTHTPYTLMHHHQTPCSIYCRCSLALDLETARQGWQSRGRRGRHCGTALDERVVHNDVGD